MTTAPPSLTSFQSKSQTGVVLIVALALLVVIGFSSAIILRGALFGGLISGNITAAQSAQHAAEVAMRICQARILNPASGSVPPIVPIPDNAGAEALAWQDQDNWSGSNAVAVTVLAADLQDNTQATARSYNRLPQCLIERLPINTQMDPGSRRNFGFQITARGFSPDYTRTSTGSVSSGSETILQMVLRMNSCAALLNQPDCP